MQDTTAFSRCQRALCALAACFATSAHAVLLAPSTGSALAGTTPPAGQLLAQQDLPFELLSGASTLASGHLSQSVLREHGTGQLRFEYRLFVDAASPGPVNFISPASFEAFTTDVDFVIGSAGDLAPTGGATRSPNAIFVSFFPGAVNAGQSTMTMFVRTDATAYDSGGWARMQQGSVFVDRFGAFQPAVVPEPATAALWFAGLALLWSLRRRPASRAALPPA